MPFACSAGLSESHERARGFFFDSEGQGPGCFTQVYAQSIMQALQTKTSVQYPIPISNLQVGKAVSFFSWTLEIPE